MHKHKLSLEANVIIRSATETLKKNDNPSSSLDSRILLGHAMGLDRSIYPHENIDITQDEINTFKKLIKERQKGKPVSRIIRKKEFWKMIFTIDDSTLDPRPDSEVIIQTILNHFIDKSKKLRVLDLGSGSGCLGLSILDEYKKSEAIFFDISKKSLEMVKLNSLNHKLYERAKFVHMNWFDKKWDAKIFEIIKKTKFDIIIANPPYIPSNKIKDLEIEVKKFEPILALDGGDDGLESYRCIIPKIKKILALEGKFFIEIGKGQENLINQIASSNNLTYKESNKDLSGITRVLVYGVK
jgi:release factor glutamine methyltransferase